MTAMAPRLADDAWFARLTPEERDWVRTFRDSVRERYGERIRDLRIFGSRVRGDTHEESDIDLLVLVDGLDAETERAIWSMAWKISPRLQAHVIDFDGYHAPISRASGFYKEIRKESVRL